MEGRNLQFKGQSFENYFTKIKVKKHSNTNLNNLTFKLTKVIISLTQH